MQRNLLIIGALIAVVLIGLWQFRSDSVKSGDESHSTELSATEKTSGDSPGTARSTNRSKQGRPMVLRSASGSGVVWGHVLDSESQEPVAYVDVIFRSGGQEESTTSDESGRYEISLSAGSYQIRALGDEGIARSTPPLRVGNIDRLEFNISVTRLATLRGHVTDPAGNGIGDAEVTLRTDTAMARTFPHRGEIGLTSSESDGSFELMVPPGIADLRATTGAGEVYASVPDIAAGAVIEDISLVIDRRGEVTGVVRRPDGGGAAGATVYLAVYRPGTQKYDRQALPVDDAGRFSLGGLRPGDYVIEAIKQGYGSSAPLRFSLQGAAIDEIVLSLHDPLTVSGIVVDENGDPVGGAEVAQVWLASKQRYAKQKTSSDGRFEFSGLGPGPHMIRARKEGFAAVERFDVKAPNEGIELRLMGTGGLHGTVTNSGKPISRFTVEYRAKGEKRGPSAQFLAVDGRFNIFPVDPGLYTVIISATGFRRSSVDGVEVPSAGYGDATMPLKAN